MSGHPRTHQNAILRTYAGLLLISICVYTLMYAPQPMFNSVSRDFGVDKGSTGLLVSVLINGMKSSGKKRDNLGSIGKSFRRGCNSIAESATKKEGNQPSFFVGG